MSGAAGQAAVRAELLRRLGPSLDAAGFDLEDVSVWRAGSRSVVRVVVDRDGGVDLDAVADASRLVSAELDTDGGPFPGPYVLEVSSPGVDRSLTLPRHWVRAAGRLVSVRTRDGRNLLGRVRAASGDAVELVEQAPRAGGRSPATAARAAGSRAVAGRTSQVAAGAGADDVIRVPYTEVASAVVQVEFGSGAAEYAAADTDADAAADTDADAAHGGRPDGEAAPAVAGDQVDADEETNR